MSTERRSSTKPGSSTGKSKGNSRGQHRYTPAYFDRLAAARAKVQVPSITFPENLPVSARRQDIAQAITNNQVVIVAGETGSGKTTQLPKILLQLGRGRSGQIGHTQPRRIAARSVAARIAEELDTPLGQVVGFSVRFTDQTSEKTLIKVMTDGILLAQIQRDPQLRAYDTIIIDEAHERSMNIDFLLGYLTRLLPSRPDLKVIITSATIDSQRFAQHFSPAHLAQAGGAPQAVVDLLPDAAPVIEVSGRTYPVEIRYREPAQDTDQVQSIIDACDELMACGPGDILVFLSGEREIRDALDGLEGHLGSRAQDASNPRYVELLPLYSRLSAAEQHRVFSSHPGRRIVLSTNVAETSLTVPGIRYVVDTGLARISRYSKATKVQRLPIEAISQASANQRSGRCGRVADGVAIRLYSQEDFEARPAFTEPEILRTSLASVLLHMLSVGVVDQPDEVASFPFVQPPDTRAVRDGVNLLRELGALTQATPTSEPGATATPASGPNSSPNHDAPGATTAPAPAVLASAPNPRRATRLSPIGRQLAYIPTDPRLARMMIEGAARGVGHPVTVIAAALSVQDVRERPVDVREKADQFHARFTDPTSDFLTYLNVWEYLREQQRDLSSSAFRRLCKAEFLNFLRVREWQDVVSQLQHMAKEIGLDLSGGLSGGHKPDSPDASPHSPRNDSLRSDPLRHNPSRSDSLPNNSLRRAWDADAIHRCLLSGLLSQLGMQDTGDIKASAVAHLKGEARARALRQQAKRARNEYLGARGARFAIFPGSTLSKKPPAWIMAGELVETSRLWARDVASIQPQWAEDMAGDLAKSTYSEPHWSSKQGAALATEKVLLYGLPIVTGRKVLWGKIHPEEAREMFIRHALVQGQWTTHHRFAAHNRQVLEQAEQVEARSRQRGLMASEDDMFAFYDERLPQSIVSARHFDRWWSRTRRSQPELLTLRMADVVDESAADPHLFPAQWTQDDMTFALTYAFRPGSAQPSGQHNGGQEHTDQGADGVTVHIPLPLLPRVSPVGFDWLVPGLLDDLCVATIKSLPKAVRVQLVPAPDTGAAVAAWLRTHEPAWEDMSRAGDMADPFAVAFSRAVRDIKGVDIPADAWDSDQVDRLPAHLRISFRACDDQGQVLDESKDLVALQHRLAAQAQQAVRAAMPVAVAMAQARAAQGLPADASSQSAAASPSDAVSPSDDMPPSDAVSPPGAHTGRGQAGSSGAQIRGTSAGRPDQASASNAAQASHSGNDDPITQLLELAQALADPDAHRQEVRKLLLADNRLATARVTSRWTGQQALTLASSPYPSTDALVEDIHKAAVVALTTAGLSQADGLGVGIEGAMDVSQVRDMDSYAQVSAYVRDHLEDVVFAITGHVIAALTAWRELDQAVRATTSLSLLAVVQSVRNHAASLIYDGFIAATPPTHIRHLVRYLRADAYRLDKAGANTARDSQLAWQIADVEQLYARSREAFASKGATYAMQHPDRLEQLAQVPWLIEELRVSYFAQQLGTVGTVSDKRIRKLLAANS